MNHLHRILNRKIVLPGAIYARCLQFAGASHIDEYARRNQSSERKIRGQICDGKVGEWVTYYATANHFEVSEPDMEIYDRGSKSWAEDLFFGPNRIIPAHVKAQAKSDIPEYGESWTLQLNARSGSGGTDRRIFYEPGDSLFVGTLVEDNVGCVRAIFPAKLLGEKNLLGDPLREHLIGIKKVVYAFPAANGTSPGLSSHGLHLTIPPELLSIPTVDAAAV